MEIDTHIELVIKIDKDTYNDIQSHDWKNGVRWYSEEWKVIHNGTLLPKGHGKLVDADELTKEIKSYISDTSDLHYDDLVEAEDYNSAYYNCLDEIENAPTIVEADKTESEE